MLMELTASAENALSQGPWSVVDKAIAAPSKDLYDYFTVAPLKMPDISRRLLRI
jgi:hypothetical protein